jgi:beta-phosphoglucomutase-like phosphatase (HAD superfamily)
MKQTVIFDLDGVIADTTKTHFDAERKVLQIYGVHSPCLNNYAGVSDVDMFSDLIRINNLSGVTAAQLTDQKWEIIDRCPFGFEPIPGAIQLIEYLSKRKHPMAVASGSPKKFINEVVSSLNLKPYFQALVSSEEVDRGKPAPDIFLCAAEMVGVSPATTVVIEDGVAGVRGAIEAGMSTIFLGTPNEIGDVRADLVVSSFTDNNYSRVLSFIGEVDI